MLVHIQDQFIQPQKLLVFAGMAAAQDSLHTGHHLHHAKGLNEVVVCAKVKALHLVKLRPLGGCHDDGNIPKLLTGAHACQQFDSVNAGEHDIQQDKVRLTILQGFPEACAILKTVGLHACALEGVYLYLTDAGIILYTPDH